MHPKGFEPLVEIMLSSRIKSPVQQPALPRVQDVAQKCSTTELRGHLSNLSSQTNYSINQLCLQIHLVPRAGFKPATRILEGCCYYSPELTRHSKMWLIMLLINHTSILFSLKVNYKLTNVKSL